MFLTNDKRCQNQYLRSRGLENVIEKFYQYLRMFCKINNCKTIAINMSNTKMYEILFLVKFPVSK